jgi:membrane-associated protease RseP (regulator of RpoE activity)
MMKWAKQAINEPFIAKVASTRLFVQRVPESTVIALNDVQQDYSFKNVSLMKTRYSLLGLLLLFCASLMAQSQQPITWVSKDHPEKIHAINIDKDDLALLADAGKWNVIHAGRNPCKAFIGVGTLRDEASGGLRVDYTVDNTPATTYGVREGDIILALDGVKVGTQAELEIQRDKHQQGDAFSLDILRDGTPMTIHARFKACSEQEMQEASTHVWIERDRDPCKVFIGVYTTDFANQGKGARVTGVIDHTPAKESAVQTGDVIIALDGQPVNTNTELRIERDKHQPGDDFRLTILREGVQMEISGTFKSCPTDKPATLNIPETPQLPVERENRQAPPTAEHPDLTLALESFDAFPNPTLGPVNIRFEAKAEPTSIQITDVKGGVVYNNQMNQFNGYFNEQVNLDGKSPGVYTITVKQGNKVFSKKMVLLSRV